MSTFFVPFSDVLSADLISARTQAKARPPLTARPCIMSILLYRHLVEFIHDLNFIFHIRAEAGLCY